MVISCNIGCVAEDALEAPCGFSGGMMSAQIFLSTTSRLLLEPFIDLVSPLPYG